MQNKRRLITVSVEIISFQLCRFTAYSSINAYSFDGLNSRKVNR